MDTVSKYLVAYHQIFLQLLGCLLIFTCNVTKRQGLMNSNGVLDWGSIELGYGGTELLDNAALCYRFISMYFTSIAIDVNSKICLAIQIRNISTEPVGSPHFLYFSAIICVAGIFVIRIWQF